MPMCVDPCQINTQIHKMPDEEVSQSRKTEPMN